MLKCVSYILKNWLQRQGAMTNFGRTSRERLNCVLVTKASLWGFIRSLRHPNFLIRLTLLVVSKLTFRSASIGRSSYLPFLSKRNYLLCRDRQVFWFSLGELHNKKCTYFQHPLRQSLIMFKQSLRARGISYYCKQLIL